MSFQTPITVREAVGNVHTKRYLLPAIQREVVWDVEQIERLFDSLMRDYPIGSFLFWHVPKERVGDYQFYEFVRDYHERDRPHNPKASTIGEDDITGILDGQQRLTSLYIGLKGSYAFKEPWKRWNNPQAFPIRKLYLNLLAPRKNGDETDMVFDFRFLSDQEARADASGPFWFRVGDILSIREPWEVNQYLIKNGLPTRPEDEALFANKSLFKLWSAVHEDRVINYFLEKDESLDKVLNIFIRVNSGGTPLSYSDLLLSVATAQWKHRDAREEVIKFVDELKAIGDGFSFDKDFALKASLVLTDFKDIAFKVDNFNKANMLKIEDQWDEITRALRGAVTLAASLGYSSSTLTANYAIIPIAYYLKCKGAPGNFDTAAAYCDDRDKIRRWLILSLVKRVFGGSPDTVLRPVRDIIQGDSSAFPLDVVVDKFKGTSKSLVCTADDIDNMLQYGYGQAYTFSILALLYPTLDFRNRFHIDHIHPRSAFTRVRLRNRGVSESDLDKYLGAVNSVANLQMLEGIPNQEKSDSDFVEWLDKTYKDPKLRVEYTRRHYIPAVDLSLTNFLVFVEQRRTLLRKELSRVLGA